MLNPILLETAARNLEGLLGRMSLGETVTLADEKGTPLALVVSLRPETNHHPKIPDTASEVSDWTAQMELLAKEVDAAWLGEKSALEELAEMRR